jgi:PST family polysaccharide transporter
VKERSDSYRRILFATSAVGGASIINILFGLVRMKVAALVLGTAGVGVIGLLQSLISTGAAAGGLGINQSATRQLAAERADGNEASARRALFVATAALAVLTGVLVWVSREPIARLLLDDRQLAHAVGWMGLATGLSIAAGSQTAFLAGMGKVGDVARVNILTAMLSTAAALGFLFAFREQAIIPYLLTVPVSSVLAGWVYTLRVPRVADTQSAGLFRQWRKLFGLGVAIMVGGLIASLAQLAVRGLIAQRVGLDELGLYQAASLISVTYLGFITQAMAADFYPRLSALEPRSPKAGQLINEQTEIALLLGGPVILVMIGLAKLLLSLLYAGEFAAGAGLLRWQMLGDVLRIASWPLGFALLAAGRGKTYVTLELVAFGVFFVATVSLLPFFGIEGAGIGYFIMYVLYVSLLILVGRVGNGFRWSTAVVRDGSILFTLAAALVLLAMWSNFAAAIAGPAAAVLVLATAFRRLRHLLPATLGPMFHRQ